MDAGGVVAGVYGVDVSIRVGVCSDIEGVVAGFDANGGGSDADASSAR